MILRDGLLGHDAFPPSMPVLAPPPPPAKAVEPPSVMSDRDYWILTVRPMLFAAGNLKETDAMRDEYAKVKRKYAKVTPVPAPSPPAPEPPDEPVGDDAFPGVPF